MSVVLEDITFSNLALQSEKWKKEKKAPRMRKREEKLKYKLTTWLYRIL